MSALADHLGTLGEHHMRRADHFFLEKHRFEKALHQIKALDDPAEMRRVAQAALDAQEPMPEDLRVIES